MQPPHNPSKIKIYKHIHTLIFVNYFCIYCNWTDGYMTIYKLASQTSAVCVIGILEFK